MIVISILDHFGREFALSLAVIARRIVPPDRSKNQLQEVMPALLKDVTRYQVLMLNEAAQAEVYLNQSVLLRPIGPTAHVRATLADKVTPVRLRLGYVDDEEGMFIPADEGVLVEVGAPKEWMLRERAALLLEHS